MKLKKKCAKDYFFLKEKSNPSPITHPVPTSSDEAVSGQLCGHPEAAELDGGGVLLGGQQHAVGLQVPVHDAVRVAVAQRLQDLTHVVTAHTHTQPETENRSVREHNNS